MANLTASTRNALPNDAFAVPGRKYPVNDPSHARDALSRVSANGSPQEKQLVRKKVRARFPGIKVSQASPKSQSYKKV